MRHYVVLSDQKSATDIQRTQITDDGKRQKCPETNKMEKRNKKHKPKRATNERMKEKHKNKIENDTKARDV